MTKRSAPQLQQVDHQRRMACLASVKEFAGKGSTDEHHTGNRCTTGDACSASFKEFAGKGSTDEHYNGSSGTTSDA